MMTINEERNGVSIAGLDRASVLAALHNSARKRGFWWERVMGWSYDLLGAIAMTRSDAARIIQAATDPVIIVEIGNRRLAVDLSRDVLDASYYDGFNGQGRARRVIDALRKYGSVASLG